MVTKLPEVINEEEFLKILKHTTKKSHKIAFSLGFYGGFRISEVTNLKKEEIDYGRGMLFIKEGKGGKDRYVPIPKPIKGWLKNIPIDCGIRALQRAINRISEKAIGRRIKFHLLRHSSATYYLSKGMNIREIQQFLGHSRLDTTMIYTHVNPEGIKNKMDEIFK